MKVKICGLTNLVDAKFALEQGADYLGFIFAESKREVKAKEVAEIIAGLADDLTKAKTVGVFANQSVDEINQIIAETGLDYVQLHGDESPEFCQQLKAPVIKSFKIKDESSLAAIKEYEVFAYLLDTYYEDKLGGGGESFDWNLVSQANLNGKIFLAGGIDLDNVEEAIKLINPYCIDVCSGVEAKPGKKDHGELKEFVEQVKEIS